MLNLRDQLKIIIYLSRLIQFKTKEITSASKQNKGTSQSEFLSMELFTLLSDSGRQFTVDGFSKFFKQNGVKLGHPALMARWKTSTKQ